MHAAERPKRAASQFELVVPQAHQGQEYNAVMASAANGYGRKCRTTGQNNRVEAEEDSGDDGYISLMEKTPLPRGGQQIDSSKHGTRGKIS